MHWLLTLSWRWCGFNRGWIHHGHIFYMVARASIRHATPANVLIPLKHVKYERIWKWLHGHPTVNVDAERWILEAKTIKLSHQINGLD